MKRVFESTTLILSSNPVQELKQLPRKTQALIWWARRQLMSYHHLLLPTSFLSLVFNKKNLLYRIISNPFFKYDKSPRIQPLVCFSKASNRQNKHESKQNRLRRNPWSDGCLGVVHPRRSQKFFFVLGRGDFQHSLNTLRSSLAQTRN